MFTITKQLNLYNRPTKYKNKKRRRIIINANRHKQHDKRIKLAEVISGRSSMYGVVFGSANWGLTGLDVIDQIHQVPFALLGVMSAGFVTYSMLKAESKLLKKDFENYATRKTGRVFMLIFAYMLLISLSN
jgi:hypothetical protein